jgi:hypothetical protein
VGLIRFRGQFDYAACLSVNILSNSAAARSRSVRSTPSALGEGSPFVLLWRALF